MKYILSIIIFVISFLSTTALIPDIIGQQGERGEQGMLGVSIPSGTALFETSLQAPITKTATTMTVRANSVSGGNTLSGYQCFTIDEGSAQAEFVCGTISGTTVSSMTRGVDPITATSTNSALQFSHRRGANVKITDFPLIQVMRNIINGGESFPNALTFDGKLTYSSAPSFTNNLDIVSKTYADNIANQGAATSSETVAGIVELATLAEQASGTPWGATEPHVMASENATSSPDGSGSAYYVLILNAAGKIAQSALDLTANFTFSGLFTVTGTTTLATTTATTLTVGDYVVAPFIGGDGTDGALTVTTGTTTIDLAGARIVVKNYTSISITGDGEVAFSNPHANGSMVIFKSQGDVTLTSSATPMLDLEGIGATGGAAVSSTGYLNGNTGTTGNGKKYLTNAGVAALHGSGMGTAGAGGATTTTTHTVIYDEYIRYNELFVGAGAGSGSVGGAGNTGTSGAGGRGGGSVVIECGGSWNFTTTDGISVGGKDGGDGTVEAGSNGGGGGGGGGGFFLALYASLTANTGTVTVSGGTGGLYIENTSADTMGGGGGGAGYGPGYAGTTSTTSGTKTGGDGGDGLSIIQAI